MSVSELQTISGKCSQRVLNCKKLNILTIGKLDRFIVVWGHHRCHHRLFRYVAVAFHRQFGNALGIKDWKLQNVHNLS